MFNNLVFYFIIYSFLGWCLESVYKTIIFKKPTNSGFLYGPFCPIYGLGALLMISISSISNNIFVIFILGFIVFTAWEYLVAVILEKAFKTKYWDYSNLKFNIQGRICLKNSIYWGILGILLVYIIQPQIEKLTNLIPLNILTFVNIVLCFAVLVDSIITIYRIMLIDKKISQIFELGESIKNKLSELKNVENIEKTYKENIQNLIKDLKAKQNILKIKIYKRIIRLKKAFPDIYSDNIAKFMKQKIELKDLKEKIKNYKEKKRVK